MPANNYSQATDVGLMRDNNEDAILSNPRLGLWSVADGMGGHAAGEVASSIALETLNRAINAGQDLEHGIKTAHQAILEAAQNGTGKPGMGSTVVALKSQGHHYQIAWVGDSRAYLWSHPNGQAQLQQLTTDHSYVQMLYQSGVISEEEMASHPEKNIITQCLGSMGLTQEQIHVSIIERQWQQDDQLLLCSDGLTDAVSDQEVCDLLSQNPNLEDAVPNLVQAALRNGGKDNISVIMVSAPSGLRTSLQAKLDRLTGRWRHLKNAP